MRDDFNDQFREHFEGRSESLDIGPSMPKWLIGALIGLVIAMTAVIIMGTVFLVKTLDSIFLESDSSDTGSSFYEDVSDEDSLAGSLLDSNEVTTSFRGGYSSASSLKTKTENFKFGTISGTSYYSEFSGVSFKAPSDWNLSTYSDRNYTNLMNPKDMSASNSDMSCSVVLSYSILTSNEKASDALSTQIKLATQGANNVMVNDSVSATYGGNHFTGILYKKEMEYMTYYIQAMVAEVNGYALEIYIEAPTEEELQTVLAMFK